MKNSRNLLYILAALALVIIVAAVAYNSLSDKYSPVAPSIPDQSGEQPSGKVQGAADFTVIDGDGNQVSLSEKFDKPIVVNLWATWCGPCRSELPGFDAAYREYGDRVNFMMVDLTDGYEETVEGTKAFVADNGYTFPVYFDVDQSAAIAYEANSIPRTIFINQNGSIYYSQIGSMEQSDLFSLIDGMLAAQ